MLTLLSVYSESARQDFLLPAAENVTLCARAERFGLGRDIALTLSAAGGWHFTGPCTASLRHAGVPYADQPLKAGDSLAYYLSGRVALVLLVRQQASPFAAYDRYRVRPGSIYIGSAADCGLQFTFSSGGQQYITQYHAELRFDGTSFGICDRSRNGVFVNGRRVRGSAALAFGDEVDIWGLSLVILNSGLAVRRTPGLTVASGVLTPGNQPAVPLGAALSQTVCHRAPRSLAPLVAAPITPEAAPAGDAGFLSAILPGRRAEQQTAHTAWLARVTAQLQDRCDANTRVMHAQYPSAAHCLQDALAGRHLWQRNPAQADFLTCRAGLGDVPSGAALALPADAPAELYKLQKKYAVLHNVPVALDLAREPLVGLVGGPNRAGAWAMLQSLAAQLAVQCCYTDVKFAFLLRADAADRGDFCRWLPHVRAENGLRLAACGREEARTVCAALAAALRVPDRPHYVVFVEETALLAGESLAAALLDPAADSGVTAVFLADTAAELPNACGCILEQTTSGAGVLRVHGITTPLAALDAADPAQLDAAVRRLARTVVSDTPAAQALPERVDFFALYGVHSPAELRAADRWQAARPWETLSVPIGVAADGLCALDAHEQAHGPHGLVAGTTGSGKSETLQTYILSLAVAFSPADAAFFLIDYKGGGMANLFAGLPHVQGAVSNLSGALVRRAMAAIESEIRRRQRIFERYSVNSINQYTPLCKNGGADTPVPHLFIIVDEFAELKREQPEFMRKLISVAQVGRSLGVHLILATQRPAGNVDENILSNTRFRLCLRVQDKQNSMEVLYRPDAAALTGVGRGYLQVGSDEVFTLFQSGWSGAPAAQTAPLAKRIDTTGRPVQSATKAAPAPGAATQLSATVDYLRTEAERLHLPALPPLWLPPLPARLVLPAAPQWPEQPARWELSATVGRIDDPENQCQLPLVVNFTAGGHHALVGAPGSGKSTFVETLLHALARRYTPDALNIYALDCTSRRTAAFAACPQVGAVLDATDLSRVGRLFVLLDSLLTERQTRLQGGNYAQYVAAHDVRDCPAVLLVVEDIAAFRERTACAYDDALLRLAREGAACGIYLFVTGNGFGMQDIPARLADALRTVLVLELPDRARYGETLRCRMPQGLPTEAAPGRGLTVLGGRVVEFQTALAVDAPDDYARADALRRESEALRTAWPGRPARRVPGIPAAPTWRDLTAHEDYAAIQAAGVCLPFGYDLETAALWGVDLQTTFCFAAAGRAGSGRGNALKILIRSAAAQKARIFVLSSQNDGLHAEADALGAEYATGADAVQTLLATTIGPEFGRRSQLQKTLPGDPDARWAAMRQEPLWIVVLPDLTDLLRLQTPAGRYCQAVLVNLISRGAGNHIVFAAALDPADAPDSEVYRAFARRCTGVWLGGGAAQQTLWDFAPLPYRELAAPEKPGIGLVPPATGHSCQKILIPQAKG
ncbi:type VII secretion protein EssC [Gemmiger sp.]|uniref:type VII secretion protein EssC n=1 Tax=Gemmiger sp. TaxID=2049027 RepID=UPI003AEFF688